MFKKYLLVVLFFIPSLLLAQAKLDRMLKERDSMHREWKASESKKTGLFGNRTKKDMIETNEWMQRIIQKDNQIMEELRLMSEIEKTEINYEKNDYKFISQKQEREIALLKRALEEKDLQVVEKKSGKRIFEWTTFIFFLSTIGLGYFYWKKVKA
jgi:preprotein translocase subunit SecG